MTRFSLSFEMLISTLPSNAKDLELPIHELYGMAMASHKYAVTTLDALKLGALESKLKGTFQRSQGDRRPQFSSNPRFVHVHASVMYVLT